MEHTLYNHIKGRWYLLSVSNTTKGQPAACTNGSTLQQNLAYDLAAGWEPNGVQLLTRARGVSLINSKQDPCSQPTELAIPCDMFCSTERLLFC